MLNLTTNKIAAIGSTTQVFMNVQDRTLELIKPEFYENWEKNQNWKEA